MTPTLAEPHAQSVGAWIRNRFIAGIFVVAPIAIVIWVLQLIYHLLNVPSDIVIRFLIEHRWLPHSEWFIEHTSGTIPGAGFFVTLFFVFWVGLTVSHIVGRRLLELVDRVLSFIPVVKTIYQSIQQLLEAVQKFSDKSKSQNFSQVVFVKMVGAGTYCMGFLTSQFVDPNGKRYGTVFVPTPPSPVNGLLFVVSIEDLIPADFISVEQATKMIISMGLVSPSPATPAPPPAG